MPDEIFYWILSMSIAAAVTGLPVLLARLVKRLPRRVLIFLWAIPYARMVLPIGLNSPFSLMSLLSGLTARTVAVFQPADQVRFSMMNFTMAAESYFPLIYKSNMLETVFRAASMVWLLGALALLSLLAAAYAAAFREIRDARPLRENIYLSDKVTAPAVYGIFRPRILLPASWKGDTELALLHERTHIRSGDNLWRLLALAVTAVHWFNPFCWLFLRLFLTDLELSCDERVLARLGADRRKEYARVLLESRERAGLVCAFGGAKISARIENILSFRRLTRLSLTACITLIGALFWVLLTNG